MSNPLCPHCHRALIKIEVLVGCVGDGGVGLGVAGGPTRCTLEAEHPLE